MSFRSSQFGPRPRDELAALSTAPVAEDSLPAAPGLSAPSPGGSVHHVGGLDVFVRETPGPSGRPATWYIHGLDGSSRNWDRLAAVLREESGGYAVDLPGTGQSAPPCPDRYSIHEQAALCATLIRRAGRPVHVVGNSRGGVIAVVVAAKYPELVRTLTLISPAVPDLRLFGERGADPRLALVMVPGTLGPAVRRIARMSPLEHARALAQTCFGEPDLLTGSDLAAAERDFAARSALPWTYRATVKSLRSLIRAQLRPGRSSFAAAARAVRAPTLVVWGTRDRLVDARLAQRTAARFADGRLLLIPATGHVAQMERPITVARAMLAMWRDAVGAGGGRDAAGAPRSSLANAVGT